MPGRVHFVTGAWRCTISSGLHSIVDPNCGFCGAGMYEVDKGE